MTLTSRVKNAISAFNGQNQTVKNSLANPAADFLRFGNRAKPIYQDWSQVEMSDQDMYTGYSYAAIDKRANRGAILGKNFLYTKGSDSLMDQANAEGTQIIHPYLPLISESVDFSENEFWYGISTYLDLEGIYYLMAVRAVGTNEDGTSKVGAVQKFSMMNPYQVHRVVKEADGTVGGYIESKDGMYREIPKEMIIEIRKLNPFENDLPYSMTDAAKESQFTLKQAGDYTRHSIKGNINAPGAITTDVVLEDHIFDNFVSRIQNHDKGEPLYGNGSGAVNWSSMQIDLDKAALDTINDIHRSVLFSVAGVNDVMMGHQEAGTGREVSKTQKDDFTENAVMPQIEKIIDALNLDYRKWYNNDWVDDKYEIALDNPLESDRDAELKDIEIRQNEHDMVVALVGMGYEFDLAAKYAHGDITLLELGEPTLEPQLTPQMAQAQAAAAVGLPAPGSTQDGEDNPDSPNTTAEDPNAPNTTTNKIDILSPSRQKARNMLTSVKFVDPKENEKVLKEAMIEAKKLKKQYDADQKKAAKEAEKSPEKISELPKEQKLNDEDTLETPADGKTTVDEEAEKKPKSIVTVEVTTPNSVANTLKATNQISAADYPSLYDGIDVNWDGNMATLGCIMMNTNQIPIAQYIKNPDADLFTKPGWGGGLAGEDEAHVTLLFGLLENGNVWKDKVDMLLQGWKLPEVVIDEVSYFDLGDSYAIIGLVRPTPEVVDGNERLSLLPHVNTFSEYHPHITLAYIKHDVDPAKWVSALAKKYNGQKIATTGLNYGDTPEEVAAKTTQDNSFEAQQAILSPVEATHDHDCGKHANAVNTTLQKAVNALQPDMKDKVVLQESNLYNAVAGIEANIVNQVIIDIKNNKFDEAKALITESQKNEFISQLSATLASFFTILFPIYANQLMQARASQFQKQGIFSMDNPVNSFIKDSADQDAQSHVNTVLGDLELAATAAFHAAAETELVSLVEVAAQKQDKDVLKELPTNPNHEDIVKAVKEGKFDEDPIYKRARELAREGNGLDAITRSLKNEYQQISKNRARTIARHETNRVFNMAQYQADIQFLNESGLMVNAYKVLYSRTGDPCPFCAKLIDESKNNPIPFQQNFVSVGDVVTASFKLKNGKMSVRKLPINYEDIMAGNIHVNCQCEYELIIKNDDGSFLNGLDVRVVNTLGYIQDNSVGNPNHDKAGRFTTGSGGSIGTTVESANKYVAKNYGGVEYTDEEKAAIHNYTGSMFSRVNRTLRDSSFNEIPSYTGNTLKTTEVLKQALHKTSLVANTTLYRGANSDKPFKVGQTITDKGFSSTSLRPEPAEEFTQSAFDNAKRPDKYVMKITAKTGTNGIFPQVAGVNSGENEFILPPSSSFRVDKITKSKDEDYSEIEATLL